MAGFDPDAYLATPVAAPAATFDPDAYLAAPAKAAPVVNAALKKAATAPVIGPVGQGEAILNAATGLGSSAIGGLAGLVGSVLPGPEGQGAEWSKKVQEAGTYQPRTESGKAASSIVAKIFNLPQDVGGAVLSAVPNLTTDRMRMGRGLQLPNQVQRLQEQNVADLTAAVGPTAAMTVAGLVKPVTSIATTPYEGVGLPALKSVAEQAAPAQELKTQIATDKAQAASDKDWGRSALIDAANIGRKNNLTMNPAVVNPSAGATINNMIVNPDYFHAAASVNNAPKFNEMVRQEIGVPKNTPLSEETFSKAKEANGAAYREAANLGTITPDADLVAQIQNIEVPNLMGTSEVNAGRVRKLTDSVVNALGDGVDAAELIKTTTALRRDAKGVYDKARKEQVDPTDRAMADAKMEIADILDQHLELNASPELANRLKDSRVKFAQIYNLERATNLATHQVDPMIFASEMSGKNNLTGAAAEMGQFAANMPEVSNVYAKQVGSKIQMPVRSGPAGTFGYAAGSLVGAPVATSAVSAGIASLGGKLKLAKMLSDEYQAANAIPLDRRIPLANPAEAPHMPAAGSNQVVPYDYAQTINDQNFVAGQPGQPAPIVSAGYEQPQLGFRTSKEAVLEKEAQRSAAAKAAAEQQAAAEASVPRQPTSGGMLFDLDPVTGKLRAADQGVKGATPEIWQENLGKNLKSAVDKMASGQAFKLTAAEKIAWEKTPVDIQRVLMYRARPKSGMLTGENK